MKVKRNASMGDDNIDWRMLYPKGRRSKPSTKKPPKKEEKPKPKTQYGFFTRPPLSPHERRVEFGRKQREKAERREAAIEKEFIDEMTAKGRFDILDEDDGYVFDKWKKEHGYDD
jgi:hypothetical protein